MGRASNRRQEKQTRKAGTAEERPDAGRRRLIIGGAGGLGALAVAIAGYRAWFGEGASRGASSGPAAVSPTPGAAKPLPPVTLASNQANAISAATDIVSHYTRELKNASSGIHALRGMGRQFTLEDGTNIVDFLCSRFAAEREVGGRRYVYFPREHEVHDNSFLKTLLEAGVAQEQVIMAGGNRYTLRDLGESAKALFRFDPGDIRRFEAELPEEHLPWCLIAFSKIAPPDNSTWTNAWGEKIDLHQVIDLGLADYESVCAKLTPPTAAVPGEPLDFRERITKYSCYGMHAFYGFFACYGNGYRSNDLGNRLSAVLEHLILRLERDVKALAEETEAARAVGQQYIARMGAGPDGKRRGTGAPPPEIIDVMSLNNFIITSGHALEAINFVRLNKLFPLSATQLKKVERQEAMLYEGLVKMRSFNLDAFMRWDPKFVSNLVISHSHALRAIKLLGPANPDRAAQTDQTASSVAPTLSTIF